MSGRGGSGAAVGWTIVDETSGAQVGGGEAAGGDGPGDPGGAGAGKPGAGAGSGSGASGAGQSGSGNSGSGAGAGTGDESYLVYASTDTTLFALDPTSPDLTLTELGDFECVDHQNGPYSSMVDIAVDRWDKIWGIAGNAVIPLYPNGGKVACGPAVPIVASQPGQVVPTFYGLTFAPVGVLHPTKEVLVAGNSIGELWSIDAAGTAQKRGHFGTVPEDDGNGFPYDPAHVGKLWELSGDIVFLANDGEPVGFATVRDCPKPPSISGCSKTDTLIEIDLSKLSLPQPTNVTKAIRGKILKEPNCGKPGLVTGSMFGIAAWDDMVFGFSRTGRVVRIDTADAAGCLMQNYPDRFFSGAGVTTLAPVELPPLQ